jgi:hypothetical protein
MKDQVFREELEESPNSLAGILVGALAPFVVTGAYCLMNNINGDFMEYFALSSLTIPFTSMTGAYLEKYF